MVYIYNKTIKESTDITNIKKICEKNKVSVWDKTTTSTYFWNRIDSVTSSKTKKTSILKEAASMIALGFHDNGWGLIGSTALDGQISITKAKGDKMVQVLEECSKWSVEVAKKGYITALHDHLVEIHEDHDCEVFPYPGHRAYPEVKVCSTCARVMERTVKYICSVKKVVVAKNVETETKVEAETKVETETMVEEKVETKVETETEVEEKVETETEVETEVETETEVEEKVETEVETEVVTETKVEEMVGAESKVEKKAEEVA